MVEYFLCINKKGGISLQLYGIDAIVRIVSHFAFIYLAFWSLQSLRTDTAFKAYRVPQVRIFFVLLSIALGYLASSFFLEVIALCRNLFLGGL